jgi:peptidoglycan L-alanyl-D-glutamate endopeptidase CwlK
MNNIKDWPISGPRLMTLHPKLRDEAINIFSRIYARGVNARCVYCLRTFQEQALIFAQGRTRPGKIVTWARPGFSYHNFGLALDFCLIDPKNAWNMKADLDKDNIPDWMEVVVEFERAGWEWGGRWKRADTPHFQKVFNIPVAECLRRYNNKNFIPGTNYINI